MDFSLDKVFFTFAHYLLWIFFVILLLCLIILPILLVIILIKRIKNNSYSHDCSSCPYYNQYNYPDDEK
jgi:hypothetical protein